MSGLANPLLTAALTNDVTRATALYNESLTYLRLASDHAKFIRNYFDPTQERLFRLADSLAAGLDRLRAEICVLQEPVSPAVVDAFIVRAAPVIQQLIAFKQAVADLIRACQTQQLLPADFIDHLRREAEFFLSIVSHVMGQPTATRGTLDLPGPPQERVATVARVLLDRVPLVEAQAADFAYTEFWGKHHKEHADALLLLLRPQQEDLIQKTARFRDLFSTLVQEARAVETNPSIARLDELDRDTLLLTRDWRQFLIDAQAAQLTCSLQANFPQRLTEHIRIETEILMEAVGRVARRRLSGGAPTAPVPGSGATFQQLTEKGVLCSAVDPNR